MVFFDRQYLSSDQLKGFEHYKYSSVDTSPLSNYVFHPFWNKIVQFYPHWLAPNVLTLSGFISIMFALFVVSCYDYDLTANSYIYSKNAIPKYVWLLCAICTFAAHTLDGTDGKQARRTNSSGPIGELFDHGLDSWSILPIATIPFSVFGRGEFGAKPLRYFYVLIGSKMTFLLTHWEKYNTGILYLPWAYDFSQLILMFFYTFCYFMEYEWFKFYVFENATFVNCFEIVFHAVWIFPLFLPIYNVIMMHKKKLATQSSLYEILLPLWSPFLLFTSSICWAKYSSNNIIEIDPRIFFCTTSTVFSNIVCKLIVAQMSSTRFESNNLLLSIYFITCQTCLLGGLTVEKELLLLRILCFVCVSAHLHYGTCLVRQLCSHLEVHAFSLNTSKDTLQKR